MMWIINNLTGNYQKMDVLSAKLIETVNSERSLSITTKTEAQKYDSVVFKNPIGEWQEYIVQGIVKDRDTLELYLEHSIYELHNVIIRDLRPKDMSPSAILSQILEESRWSVGANTYGGLQSMSLYYISAYAALKALVEKTGGELEYSFIFQDNRIVSRQVNIVNRLGSDNGRIFKYSKDLSNVKRSIDKDVITALIGRGKGEQISDDGFGRRLSLVNLIKPDSPEEADYVENIDAKELYGINKSGVMTHRFGIINFDDITDQEELYIETKKILENISVPQFTYEASVILLNKPEEQVDLGDTVYILDPEFGDENLKLVGRILKIEHDLVNRDNTVITVGNLVNDLAYYQKQIASQLEQFRANKAVWDRSSAFNADNKLPASYIQSLLEAWNEEANQSGGFTYTVEGQGTITYDRAIDDGPTQAVQIVGGSIRFANSKSVNGEWEWRTILNANGIAGQEIAANSITANHLSSDIGSNLDLSSNESITLTVKSISYEKSEIDTIIDDIELTPGPPGTPAVQWTIGADGYWYADGVKTDKKAVGEDGTDGVNPDIWTIGPNGNWFKNGVDTGQPSQGEKGDKGDEGPQGVPGPKGEDGESQYVHIRYSTNASGSPMTESPEATTKYIGLVNTTSPTAPSSGYTWSKYIGEDGEDGVGIQGPPGENGQPTYTWVKYADTPTDGMDDYPEGKKYIGLAFNKTTQTESTVYNQYQWSLMPQNIEVGGRNLLLKSDIAVTNSSYPTQRYDLSESMVLNQKYTLRLWGTLGAGKTKFAPYLNGGIISLGAMTNNGDGTFSLTFLGKSSGVITGDFLNIYPIPIGTVIDSTIDQIKLEKGDTATDWTPAPEDIDAKFSEQDSKFNEQDTALGELVTISQTNSSQINLLEGAITSLVTQETHQTSLDSLQENLEGYVTGEVETRITDYSSEVNQKFDNVTTTFTGVTTSINKVGNDLQASIDNLETYIRFDINGIELGEKNNPIKLFIENDKIVFKQNDFEVAYIDNNKLYITDGEFLKSLRLGNFAFTPRTNKNLSFGKVV